jgi:hypothetical protein
LHQWDTFLINKYQTDKSWQECRRHEYDNFWHRTTYGFTSFDCSINVLRMRRIKYILYKNPELLWLMPGDTHWEVLQKSSNEIVLKAQYYKTYRLQRLRVSWALRAYYRKLFNILIFNDTYWYYFWTLKWYS